MNVLSVSETTIKQVTVDQGPLINVITTEGEAAKIELTTINRADRGKSYQTITVGGPMFLGTGQCGRWVNAYYASREGVPGLRVAPEMILNILRSTT